MPLVFVPTPLGNLRDITLRGIDALRDCTLLVAEDTRVARKLLSALALPSKEMWSYHEHNTASALTIVSRAQREVVAVVSDAGTPGISDPGSELVQAAREAGVPLEVLPGPSALIGAAVLSGFPLRRFVFEGFAPRTSGGRKDAFARTMAWGIPSVWYESPARVHAMLRDLDAVEPQARVFLLREYTKRFEQHLCGSPAQVAGQLSEPVKGEIVIVVMPTKPSPATASASDLDTEIDTLLTSGKSVSAIAKSLAERGYGDRRHIYARVSARKKAGGPQPLHSDTGA